MIFLAGAWIVLGGFSFVLGQGVLSLALGSRRCRFGDRLILSGWIGLMMIEWAALSISFVSAVTPAIMFSVVAVAAVVVAVVTRIELVRTLRRLLRADMVVIAVVVLTSCGLVASGLRPTPDTGNYHYPAVRWLAEYGTVPGVAHILIRLGFISDTWALIAPFDLLWPGRASAIVNGFILVLISLQMVIVAARMCGAMARRSDLFLGAASIVSVAIGLLIGSFTNSTPDQSVVAFSIIALWRVLSEGEDADRRPTLIPMILACGALNAKLSALLLAPAAALYAVVGARPRKWLFAAVLGAALTAPFFIASVVASGCLAVPVALTCLPVPWALPANAVRELNELLLIWTRWNGPQPSGAGTWDWIPGWFLGSRYWLNAALFWPAAVCFIAFLAVARRNMTRAERWILAFILPSLLLMFVAAPDPRYNFALFIAPIALLAMRIAPQTSTRPVQCESVARWAIIFTVLLAVTQIGASISIERHRASALGIGERLFRPRHVPDVEFTRHQGGGFEYTVSADPTAYCWGAPLPCTDQGISDVRLRDPEKGISGGFEQVR